MASHVGAILRSSCEDGRRNLPPSKNCVKKNHTKQTKKLIPLSQRIQAVTEGYFGGYIGKRQPGGKAEVKKCINHMYALRNKLRGQGTNAEQRAVSEEMIADLEMNGTYHGAVEIFNLRRYLDTQDVFKAEYIRTFGTDILDGHAWLWSRANLCDAYGLRPMKLPWMFLSPYEFFREWRVEPLSNPIQYEHKAYPDKRIGAMVYQL